MRQKNWRVIITGFILTCLALGFYYVMLTSANKSTDPVALMETVGTVSGVAGGIALVMIIFELIGKKTGQSQ